jgi:hypothetical protein
MFAADLKTFGVPSGNSSTTKITDASSGKGCANEGL